MPAGLFTGRRGQYSVASEGSCLRQRDSETRWLPALFLSSAATTTTGKRTDDRHPHALADVGTLPAPVRRAIGAGRTATRQGRSRKEVFQPHLPVRLPCYDLAPVTCLTLGRSSRSRTSGTPSSHGLTGGVYKARERIHRAMADARLLANPASRSRVADSDPN